MADLRAAELIGRWNDVPSERTKKNRAAYADLRKAARAADVMPLPPISYGNLAKTASCVKTDTAFGCDWIAPKDINYINAG